MNDNESSFKTGEELLQAWGLITREQRLEQSVKALMAAIEELHVKHEEQSLAENIDNKEIFCSCADAYRMGAAALKVLA